MSVLCTLYNIQYTVYIVYGILDNVMDIEVDNTVVSVVVSGVWVQYDRAQVYVVVRGR